MSDKDNSLSFFVVGFLAGCLSSAIVAILYAPKSGEETRQVIREKSDEWISSANRSVDQVYKQAEVATNSAVERFNEFAAQTKEQTDAITQRGKEFFTSARGIFKNAAEQGEDDSEEIITTATN